MANANKGAAFERTFAEAHDLNSTSGWASGTVRLSNDTPRDFDLIHQLGELKLAYELKSGSAVDVRQVAKDQQLILEGWQVTYIFGAPPTPSAARMLEKAGIPYSVWHSEAVPVG